MPKFVPVVDTEKPLSEQAQDRDFEKHRRFDNPHKVDRGWQQGSLGWGVKGAFGSDGKDDSAQLSRRTDGGNKMVKNDKGLWVKAKELEGEDAPVSKPGRGRGGGVSVLGEMADRLKGHNSRTEDTHNSSHGKEEGQFEDLRARSSGGQDRSRDDSRNRRGRDRDRSRDRHRDKHDKHSRRSRSRSQDRRDRKDEHRGGDRYRDNDRRVSRRSPSRSRSRSHGRDRHGDSKKHSSKSRRDSRSRSRSRGGGKHSNNRDRDLDRDHRKRHRSESPDGKHSREEHNKESRRDKDADSNYAREDRIGESNDGPPARSKAPVSDDNDEAEMAALLASITAVQVVNRFHEVFSTDTLFPSERLKNIEQLLAARASIASLKTGSVHLSGQEAIRESFAKTSATPCVISKRMYIEQEAPEDAHSAAATGPAEDGEESEVSQPASRVTFCLDFHRPGTAPGLGDRAKHTVLLYRCQAAHLTQIWGMVDHEQLSAPEDLEMCQVTSSKVWALVKAMVLRDLPSFDESRDAHFHNYDKMEVWGMF